MSFHTSVRQSPRPRALICAALMAADAFSRSDTLHSQAAVRTSAAERGRSEARRGRDQGIASETVVGGRWRLERKWSKIYSPPCLYEHDFMFCNFVAAWLCFLPRCTEQVMAAHLSEPQLGHWPRGRRLAHAHCSCVSCPVRENSRQCASAVCSSAPKAATKAFSLAVVAPWSSIR